MAAPALSAAKLHLHIFRPKSVTIRGHGHYANSSLLLMRTHCLPLRTFSIRCSSRSSSGHSEGGALLLDSLGDSIGGAMTLDSPDGNEFHAPEIRAKKFTNRFLNLVRLGSVMNDAAESFFKSEIRRRLFVTAVLILVSRIGYFIPLPGFDRRMMPEDYLSFGSGSMDDLGDFTAELKMSFFQLGISPQIGASIVMQDNMPQLTMA